MAVFIKRITPKDPAFSGRVNQIMTMDDNFKPKDVIYSQAMPNDLVICNGCNANMYPDGELWFVYLGIRELRKNQPYDCYCGKCVKHYFPKAVEVKD